MFRNKWYVKGMAAATAVVVLATGTGNVQAAVSLMDSDGSLAIQLVGDDESIVGKATVNGIEYETTKAFKTTFQNTFVQDAYKQWYTVEEVRADIESGKLYIDMVWTGEYYEAQKGWGLYLVHSDIDKSAVQEAQRELDRIEQHQAELEANHQTNVDEADYQIWIATDSHSKKIAELSKQKMQLDYDYEKASLEAEHEECKKRVDKLDAAESRQTIDSPIDGIVGRISEKKEGDAFEDGDVVAYIVPQESFGDKSYLATPDPGHVLTEGMDVRINSNYGNCDGKVVSANVLCLGKDFDKDYSVICVENPTEGISFGYGDMKAVANVRNLENALVVKLSAVTKDERGYYFVTRLKEDGTTEKVNITCGGENNTYVWVLEGLEEGDTLLVKK